MRQELYRLLTFVIFLFSHLLFPEIAQAGLTAPATSTGTYTVSWTESSGGLRRAYLYESADGGTWRVYTVTGTRSKTFTKSPGTYTYKLRGCFFEPEINREICGPYSDEVTVVVTTAAVPGAPGSLGPGLNSTTGVYTLSWGAASGSVTQYELYERVGTNGSWNRIHNAIGRSKTLNRNDGVYFYRARACNNSGCGGYTANKKVTVLKIPSVPGNLGPNVTVGPYYTISWTASSGTVQRYELLEQKGTGAWQIVHSSTASSKVFRNKEAATYRYKVRACNRAGCSAYTADKRVVVQLVKNIFGPSFSTGAYTLTWRGIDIAELQERKQDSNWRPLYKGRGSRKTFYKYSSNSEGVYEYRLRHCIPPEPGVKEYCFPWGAVHKITVDHPENFSLTSSSVQNCTRDQLQEWQDAKNSSLGVLGHDPVGHKIGPSPAYRTGLGMNWYPVDIYKQNFCGTLHHFNFFDPIGDEADWNNFMIPKEHYRFILEDVLPIADGDEVHDCGATDNCMEAEITPDQTFYEFPWFKKSTDISWLRGSPLCTYGAWVWEEAHGNRPEIHPSELYWWKANPDLTFLLILQEDSNRFDRRSDYEVSDPVPSWWRPWSASPRTGEFKLAIEFFKGESATTYSITDDTTQGIWKRHVITASDPLLVEDADDGKEHAIALDGQIALRLNEVQQSDDEIGIRFVNMCRDPQNPSRFQGFVSIRTRVGINDRGGEGYHFLQVERHVRDMRAVAEERPFVPAVNVFGETVKQSLRRLDSNELAFDININIAAEPGIKRERRIPKRVEIISKRTQRELVVIPGISGMAQVKNVPVNFGKQETKMNIIMQSGDVTTLYIPPIDLSPRITELAGDVVATPSVWQNFKNLSRSENIGELQNAEAVMVKEWLVESYPNYAVLRGGKISLEDDSPIAEKLNEIVYRNEIDRISELWGTAKPFAVKWKFEALNTANQQAVPVVINKKDDNAVSIYLNHGMMEDSRIRIHFPEKLKKDIIKLVATAQMTDALHNISSTQHTVWSHVITAESESVLVENLLMALAPETRMTVRDLLAISQLDIADNFQTRQPRLRRARMLRLMLMRFSADLRVTNEELRKLIVLARRVK